MEKSRILGETYDLWNKSDKNGILYLRGKSTYVVGFNGPNLLAE